MTNFVILSPEISLGIKSAKNLSIIEILRPTLWDSG
jgi:hypothetical protein